MKKLDKIGNKVVDAVSSISEGYAVYQTGDLYGAIDDDGGEVVKPEYLVLYACSDGKFIGINKKYEKEFKKKDGNKKKSSIPPFGNNKNTKNNMNKNIGISNNAKHHRSF